MASFLHYRILWYLRDSSNNVHVGQKHILFYLSQLVSSVNGNESTPPNHGLANRGCWHSQHQLI